MIQALDDYRVNPHWSTQQGVRGGQAIVAYQSRPATRGKTVCVTSFVEAGVVLPIDDVVTQYLTRNGIHRVCVGHKPVGDSPLVLQTHAFEVIMADTSYSDIRVADGRGVAAAEVVIEGDADVAAARVHGVLHDGQEYDFVLPRRGAGIRPATDDAGDRFVGYCTVDGWWVKARISGDKYLVAKTDRRTVQYEYRSLSSSQLARFEDRPVTSVTLNLEI